MTQRIKEVDLPENYRVFETDQFLNDLDRIRGKKQEKLYHKISNYVYPQIKNNPYYGMNVKKLKDWDPETWRYRIGNYRLFYEIDEIEKIISIIAFEIRGNAYKKGWKNHITWHNSSASLRPPAHCP